MASAAALAAAAARRLGRDGLPASAASAFAAAAPARVAFATAALLPGRGPSEIAEPAGGGVLTIGLLGGLLTRNFITLCDGEGPLNAKRDFGAAGVAVTTTGFTSRTSRTNFPGGLLLPGFVLSGGVDLVLGFDLSATALAARLFDFEAASFVVVRAGDFFAANLFADLPDGFFATALAAGLRADLTATDLAVAGFAALDGFVDFLAGEVFFPDAFATEEPRSFCSRWSHFPAAKLQKGAMQP